MTDSEMMILRSCVCVHVQLQWRRECGLSEDDSITLMTSHLFSLLMQSHVLNTTGPSGYLVHDINKAKNHDPPLHAEF